VQQKSATCVPQERDSQVAALDFRIEQVFDVSLAGSPPAATTKEVAALGTMRILDRSGDTAVTWDLTHDDTVRTAEALFERLVRTEKKIPFARPAGAPAGDAVQISTFDPSAEEILFVRPITGG
jgi:hypothetical protein